MALATEAGRSVVPPDRTDRGQRRRRGASLVGLGLGVGLILLGMGSAVAAPPQFDDMEAVHSSDGTLQLSWGADLADDLGEYEVQLRHEGQTRRVYHGRLPEAHVSGLENGHYEIQVRQREGDGWSEWSEPREMTVEHHPMSLVWTLMALGALVFTATAAVVLRSDRGTR